jgi:glycine/D-amino acid oxidase-like deaminating enzyme
MALPNKVLGELKAVKDPEVEEREVDILIVGGGMAATGAAFEAKKWMSEGQSVLMVEGFPGAQWSCCSGIVGNKHIHRRKCN